VEVSTLYSYRGRGKSLIICLAILHQYTNLRDVWMDRVSCTHLLAVCGKMILLFHMRAKNDMIV